MTSARPDHSAPYRRWVPVGAWLAMLAVAAGAFGAHALRGKLAADMLEVYRTAALYHFLHALALLAIGALEAAPAMQRGIDRSGWLLLAGVVVFSGSLYALALTGWRPLGAVTPIGGVLMLCGWATLGWVTHSFAGMRKH